MGNVASCFVNSEYIRREASEIVEKYQTPLEHFLIANNTLTYPEERLYVSLKNVHKSDEYSLNIFFKQNGNFVLKSVSCVPLSDDITNLKKTTKLLTVFSHTFHNEKNFLIRKFFPNKIVIEHNLHVLIVLSKSSTSETPIFDLHFIKKRILLKNGVETILGESTKIGQSTLDLSGKIVEVLPPTIV